MRLEISDTHAVWLAEQAKRLGCASEGAYIEQMIGYARAQQKALEGTLLDALDSGAPREITPAFWQDLRNTLS